jgi:hypothetical protein
MDRRTFSALRTCRAGGIYPEDMEQKGIGIGLFVDKLCHGLPEAMAGLGVNTQQNRM